MKYYSVNKNGNRMSVKKDNSYHYHMYLGNGVWERTKKSDLKNTVIYGYLK